MDDTYKRKKRAESNLLDSFMDRQEIFLNIQCTFYVGPTKRRKSPTFQLKKG